MAGLHISRELTGVAIARSVDPFDTLVVYRIEREHWKQTPDEAGVYLLYGPSADGELTVYVGMSRTSMRSRIGSHHVNARKNWFGTLFAVPVPDKLLCPAIEAELIALVTQAQVAVIENRADEMVSRNSDSVHVGPAVEKIQHALELILGSDIFTPADQLEESTQLDPPVMKMPPLARVYVAQAEKRRRRMPDDPEHADHWFVGPEIGAWGRFDGDEPNKSFWVLAGSQWRPATLNPEHKSYKAQKRIAEQQQELVDEGVLDESSLTFTTDHMFDNWRTATVVVCGKNHSGSHHWQRLTEHAVSA